MSPIAARLTHPRKKRLRRPTDNELAERRLPCEFAPRSGRISPTVQMAPALPVSLFTSCRRDNLHDHTTQ